MAMNNRGVELVTPPSQRCPYFDVVVGFVWSHDPESYAGGSIVTGKGTHAGQVKGDAPDEKGHPGPSGWGLGVGLTTPSRKKVTKISKVPRIDLTNRRGQVDREKLKIGTNGGVT
jgi:hypothetical protein